MCNKEDITVSINRDLYLQSKDSLEMSLDEFIEYSLTIYLSRDKSDEYARLFRRACKLYHELDNLKKKISKLSDTDVEEDYTDCMETVNRIHANLGYVGRNQLRNIAKNNNVSPVGLIEYVKSLDVYDVRNFGDSPKKR